MDLTNILDNFSDTLAEAILEATDNGILIIDTDRKVVKYNSRFLELWNIPTALQASNQDEELLNYVLNQLKDPNQFLAKVLELYHQPEAKSFDTISFKDERIFERFSTPMYFNSKVVARVWSFRDVTTTETFKHKLSNEINLRQAIIKTIPDLIWLKDINGIYLTCNHRFEDFFGVDEAELIGKTDYDFVDKELADSFRENDKKAMTNNAASVNEEWITFASDGHRELLETTKTPMYNTNHELIGILGIGHDITERARSTNLLQSIIQTIPLRIFWKDHDLNYLGCNTVFAKDAGFENPKQMIGKSDFDMGWKDQAKFYRADDLHVMHSGNAKLGYDEPQTTPDESKIWLRTSKIPLVDTVSNKIIGVLGVYDDITKQKNLEDSLQGSEHFLRQSQHNAGIGSYNLDINTMFWKSSATLDEIFGIDTDYEHSFNGWTKLIYPDDQEEMFTYFQENVLKQSQKFDHEYRIVRHNDQAVRWVYGLGKLECDETNTPVAMLGTIQDITERKEYEESIKLKKIEFETIFNTSKDGIAIVDMESNFLDFNDAYLEMLGFTREELLTRSCISLSAPEDREHVNEAMKTTVQTGFLVGFEKTCQRKNGTRLFINTTATVLPDKKRILINTKDITESKKHETELEYIANYDSLTGLPNRVLNADRLRQAMIQAKRNNNQIAVLYLDLDGFKEVNDRYGHSVGDKLLIALSLKMKETLREGDTLARLGGDEFIAILGNMDDISSALPIMQRVLDVAGNPIEVDNTNIQVTVSIGVTFYPQRDDVDADQLIRQADSAMYQAKQSGKNRYHIFDSEHDRTVRTQFENVERIKQALENNEFVLYYQPKVNMKTDALIGAEALIRWQHPQEGIIPPLQFLPIIENHPLAVQLGEWVINEAISQIERWQQQGLRLPLSVNVGARQLLQGDFVERLQWILSQHENFDTSLLEIEVLETNALADIIQASKIIRECKLMGIKFALDDFGTGYSSLTYLKQLPVKTLKIDQSFVRNMLDDQDDLAILEGILGLAKAFSREVIAEGVETHKHAYQLLLLGCELAQGYGISRPMPAEKMIEWSQEWNKTHTWIG